MISLLTSEESASRKYIPRKMISEIIYPALYQKMKVGLEGGIGRF